MPRVQTAGAVERKVIYMTRLLPPKANYRFLQEQAKDLLKAHKDGNAQRCNCLRLLHRFAGASDRDILMAKVALHEVQFALAMDYGFKSWDDLKTYVESLGTSPASESLVDPNSLAGTLDRINDAFFWERELSLPQKREAAFWLTSRQGQGGWAFLFRLGQGDSQRKRGEKWKALWPIFTGESQQSWASTEIVLSHESCRALILLDIPHPDVRAALERSSQAFVKERLFPAETDGQWLGTYCCPKCTCSFWRHLAVGGLNHSQERLEAGMAHLRSLRDNCGRWRGYPFYYTLLSLVDMNHPAAVDELQHAVPACQRALKRSSQNDIYNKRRRKLMERVLVKVGLKPGYS